MTKDSTTRYTAEVGGSSWRNGPKGAFTTIREAREWAESYGTTADWCSIQDRRGRLVAKHMRDPNNRGDRWFRAAT